MGNRKSNQATRVVDRARERGTFSLLTLTKILKRFFRLPSVKWLCVFLPEKDLAQTRSSSLMHSVSRGTQSSVQGKPNGLVKNLLRLHIGIFFIVVRLFCHPSESLYRYNQCDQIGQFIGPWSLWQQLICPNLPTFLGNFCKGVKIYNFSTEIIFGQLL